MCWKLFWKYLCLNWSCGFSDRSFAKFWTSNLPKILTNSDCDTDLWDRRSILKPRQKIIQLTYIESELQINLNLKLNCKYWVLSNGFYSFWGSPDIYTHLGVVSELFRELINIEYMYISALGVALTEPWNLWNLWVTTMGRILSSWGIMGSFGSAFFQVLVPVLVLTLALSRKFEELKIERSPFAENCLLLHSNKIITVGAERRGQLFHSSTTMERENHEDVCTRFDVAITCSDYSSKVYLKIHLSFFIAWAEPTTPPRA